MLKPLKEAVTKNKTLHICVWKKTTTTITKTALKKMHAFYWSIKEISLCVNCGVNRQKSSMCVCLSASVYWIARESFVVLFICLSAVVVVAVDVLWNQRQSLSSVSYVFRTFNSHLGLAASFSKCYSMHAFTSFFSLLFFGFWFV